MLIRAGHAVRASVVFALVLLYTSQPGCWDYLILTRQADDIVDGEPLPERYFSDLAAVISKLSVAKPPLRIKHAEYRKLKSIDITKLEEDIRNSQLYQDPSNDLNMLLDCYNTTLRSLLDDHEPVCSRHVSTRPRPTWFNED
ncbi:unnamed protein product, partial [Porites evermanni]